MVRQAKHLKETKSYISNLIEEGNLVEANQLLKIQSWKQFEKHSKTQSVSGRIIASDLSEFERLSGDNKENQNICLTSWRRFKVSCILYYFLLIITIFYHNRNHFILTLLSLYAFDIDQTTRTNRETITGTENECSPSTATSTDERFNIVP